MTQSHNFPKPVNHSDVLDDSGGVQNDDSFVAPPISDADGSAHEDDWQLL